MKLTALDAAKRLPRGAGRILLHGARNDDGLAERSLVACWPRRWYQVIDERWEVHDRSDGLVESGKTDPIEALATFIGRHVGTCWSKPGAGAEVDGHREVPLVIGYLGYEAGRFVEPLVAAHGGAAKSMAGVPHVWFGVYEAVYLVDERTGVGAVLASDETSRARLMAALSAPGTQLRAPVLAPLVDSWSRGDYEARVRRILEYIAAGDVYQVNLARRLAAPIMEKGDALAIYEAIVARAPAPFGAFVETGEVALVSGSPELFLRRHPAATRLETRPIKGTRRRHGDADDVAVAAELSADPKERAEHLMIVDLERNDLGRVAQPGSVRVDRFGYVVSLPTLYHLVSTVSCQLRAEVSTEDILRATFPGGSITGAPKVRAMQIIDELETEARGPYTGAIGAFGPGGSINLSIAIRTAIVRDDDVTLHVGGGIVADSIPAREYEETEEKAAAWRRALESLAPGPPRSSLAPRT